MSIFVPPKITAQQLSSLVLKNGEIVYNLSDKNFYRGDGVTSGGMQLGGCSRYKLNELQNGGTIGQDEHYWVNATGNMTINIASRGKWL